MCLHAQESEVEVGQLRRDKDELLNQVVSLQQQREAAIAENRKLCKKVSYQFQWSPPLLWTLSQEVPPC